jgi:hypothetical protein
MIHSRGVWERPAWHEARLVVMNCGACVALESVRFGRILRYVDVMERRKQALAKGNFQDDDLKEDLARAETELNQVWQRLAKHRSAHTCDAQVLA